MINMPSDTRFSAGHMVLSARAAGHRMAVALGGLCRSGTYAPCTSLSTGCTRQRCEGGAKRSLTATTMDEFMRAALHEAKQGLAEGGIPIGSVLAIDGTIVGRGRNRRVQKGSAILHAEMDCIENAGRLKAGDYQRAVLYSTLSPCDMCSGAALLYNIPKIVIGENTTFRGPEDYVRSRGVELIILNDPECIKLMRDFIAARPQLWNEDIGL
jgi:creatinine deaminase